MPLPTLQLNHEQVLINGSQLSIAFQNHLIGITVEQDLQLPSLFQIEFSGLGILSADDFNLNNLSVFEPGNPVEIKLGSDLPLPSVVNGEILGMEPSFSRDRPLQLTVWGCDYLHRLQRGTKTRSFVKMRDSDIASQIATNAGLSPKVIQSQYQHEYLMQANQSDLQFLQARSQQIGYELFLEDKTLVFQPLQEDSETRFIFDMGNDLLEFQPRLSLAGQVSKTTVSTWDVNQKKAAFKTYPPPNFSTESSGAFLANRAFGAAETVIVDRSVAVQEAESIAQAQADQINLNLITGEGTCLGKPKLKPGQKVQLKGLGQQFSGQYFVTAVTHRYDGVEGYFTDFKVKRNFR